MMRPQPMLVVDDVEAASTWFQSVLGLDSAHGGPEYEMLLSGGELVAQLHHWDQHAHPHLGDPTIGSRGNGVLVWFATDDFDAQIVRVEATGAEVIDGPLYNENGHQHEVWLRGPDGYVVVVAGPRQA